jgi:pyruvate formate lyase activating enzyme
VNEALSSASSQTVFSRNATGATGTELRVAAIQRAGMLDWPGRVTATAFLAGCNLRCPFCHNPDLIGVPRRLEGTASLMALVRERRAWLDGVVITGGEPCSNRGLLDLLRELRYEGMPVKLDTNGTMPEVLRAVLAEGLADMVALDVKATPERYERATGVRELWPLVQRSIDAVISSGVDHEFRTTCYPLAVGPDDPASIASNLAGGRRYVLQQFRPTRTLDPAAVTVRPHSAETLCRAAERCSSYLPTAVRGV